MVAAFSIRVIAARCKLPYSQPKYACNLYSLYPSLIPQDLLNC